ncbi:heparinase II/III family protein [Mesobacillus jeotgali]|uniref:heparinase II/III domain-containing protein n=1 Tax=Mesobacillus jeotgali TaxID=129985 RepID=UPI00177E4782|nr:heparinase II/III family protein [Mesobacillus jeotgali]UYZ21704.1 heparinase II/III family protein [Mesobacillus jeotgali]
MDTIQFLKDLKPHPRILFNAREIKEIKSRVSVDDAAGASAISFGEIWEEVQQQAEKYLAENDFKVAYPSCDVVLDITLPLVELDPVGDPPGYVDYPFWTMYSRAIEERIKVLSFAYGMTGDVRYSSMIKEYLLSLSSFSKWYEFPHRGAEGNLSNAHFLLGVAIGYDAVFNTLSAQEKETIEEAIFSKGLQPLEIDFDNQDSHNIIASKRVSMFVGALAILDVPIYTDRVKLFLENSFEYISTYLDNRLKDPEIEGLLYLNVAARHLLMAADILQRSASRDELINHEYFSFLPDVFMYMLGTGANASFVNFSDSFYKLDILYSMAVLASNRNHPVASWFIHRFPEKKLDLLLDFKKIPAPVEPGQFYKQNSKVFPVIGWASLRSGWQEGDHLLAFNSSESGKDHNHFDQNNFVLHTAGEWLITNPGYQDYVEGPRREFTLGTVGHNSMLVDGKGQMYRGRSRFVDYYTSEGFSYIIGDASGAYGPEIIGWERKIIHLDQRYFVMFDKVEKSVNESDLSFLFHTPASIHAGGEILAAGEQLNQNTLHFTGEKAVAEISVCYPSDAEKVVTRYPGAEQYGACLQVRLKESERFQNLVTLIRPCGSENKNELSYELFRSGPFFDLKVTDPDLGITDYLLVNEERTTVYQSSKDNQVKIKAEQGWIALAHDEKAPIKFGIVGGNELVLNETVLVHSSENINVSGSFYEESAKVKIEQHQKGKVYILAANPHCILLNGNPPSEKQVLWDSEKGVLEFELSAGIYYLDLFFRAV